LGEGRELYGGRRKETLDADSRKRRAKKEDSKQTVRKEGIKTEKEREGEAKISISRFPRGLE
jgi:hypothetical protein